MRELALRAVRPGDDVLEVGFGLGLLAKHIQGMQPSSHTVIELHPGLANAARDWGSNSITPVHVVNSLWQSCIDDLGKFHCVLFDSVSAEGLLEGDTFEFFRVAAHTLLRPGGRLGFFISTSQLPPPYQRELLRHFECVTLFSVRGLQPIPECRKAGFGDSMIVLVAMGPFGR